MFVVTVTVAEIHYQPWPVAAAAAVGAAQISSVSTGFLLICIK